MGAIERFSASGTGIAAVAQFLARCDRSQLDALIEIAIDLADSLDGDTEAEEDDPAGQCDEDEINTCSLVSALYPQSSGPGCPMSDPGECA